MKFTCLKKIILTLILSSGLFVNNANAGIIVSDNTSVTSDGQSYTNTFDVTGFEDYINLIFTVSARGDYDAGIFQRDEYIEFFIEGISYGQFRYDTPGVTSSIGATGDGSIDQELDFSFSITDTAWSTQYADDSTVTVSWSNGPDVDAFYYSPFVNFNLAGDPNPVPEPTTLAIFALGMMGLAVRRLNKKS